jgi:hypothetical protein
MMALKGKKTAHNNKMKMSFKNVRCELFSIPLCSVNLLVLIEKKATSERVYTSTKKNNNIIRLHSIKKEV